MTTTTEVTTKTYLNYINGEWIASETGKTGVSKNPARKDEVVGLINYPQAMILTKPRLLHDKLKKRGANLLEMYGAIIC